jgi:hypothetical protein
MTSPKTLPAIGAAHDADGGPTEEQGLSDLPLFTAPDRPRGLDAQFAPGGDDAATEERRADERRNLGLLLLMVALLVAIPTLLTIVAFVGQLVARHGGA